MTMPPFALKGQRFFRVPGRRQTNSHLSRDRWKSQETLPETIFGLVYTCARQLPSLPGDISQSPPVANVFQIAVIPTLFSKNMTHRPTSRLFLFIGLALFFVLTLTFLRQNSPLSPEARAPGHVDRTIPNVEISDKMLHGAVVTSKMGNETAK